MHGRAPTAQLCEPQLATAAWCGSTHYPEAGICEAYCYPGLNGDVSHAEGECPPETQFPEDATESEPEVTQVKSDAGVTQASGTETVPEMSLEPTDDAGMGGLKAPAHASAGCRAGAQGRTTQAGIAWLLLAFALWVRRRHGSQAMRRR